MIYDFSFEVGWNSSVLLTVDEDMELKTHMDRESFETALDDIADDLSDWIFEKVKGWLQHAVDVGEANEGYVEQIIRQLDEARP